MGRGQDQSAAAAHLADARADFGPHFRGRAERHGLLDADRAPERKPVAKLALDGRRVHALRLDGVEDVNADFDQVGNDGLHVAVGMVEDGGFRPGLLDRADGGGEPRLEEFAPGLQVHEHALLPGHVVAGDDDVHPGESELAGGELLERGGAFEEPMRDLRGGQQVHHQFLTFLKNA